MTAPSPLDFKNALVFTGGGTGGHFFPAVALAEGARSRWPERPIVFVGATRGIEARKLPESAWPHLLVDVEGFLGRSPMAVLRAMRKLWKARALLIRLWRKARPRAVVATGGYASAPAVLAAKALGIPFFIHESNAQPGALVKLVAKKAHRIWCGMEAVQGQLQGARCLMVGTPVREAFLRGFKPVNQLEAPFQLLVLGGSGGARALNEAVMQMAPYLLKRFPDWAIMHQTGARDFPELEKQPRHERHALVPFLEDVDGVLEQSSLLISRSGASTCAELKASGRPSILVPMPGSAGDHQTQNARAMEVEGRAVLLLQTGTLAENLTREVEHLLKDEALRFGLAKPESNRAVEACLDDLG